jgi:hypothetical protein
VRRFPQLQYSYVIEFVPVCDHTSEGADWQFSCSISLQAHG